MSRSGHMMYSVRHVLPRLPANPIRSEDAAAMAEKKTARKKACHCEILVDGKKE